jgi:hypothetical protein
MWFDIYIITFRLLHPSTEVSDEATLLYKANGVFRVQCMKAMGLDPNNGVQLNDFLTFANTYNNKNNSTGVTKKA